MERKEAPVFVAKYLLTDSDREELKDTIERLSYLRTTSSDVPLLLDELQAAIDWFRVKSEEDVAKQRDAYLEYAAGNPDMIWLDLCGAEAPESIQPNRLYCVLPLGHRGDHAVRAHWEQT